MLYTAQTSKETIANGISEILNKVGATLNIQLDNNIEYPGFYYKDIHVSFIGMWTNSTTVTFYAGISDRYKHDNPKDDEINGSGYIAGVSSTKVDYLVKQLLKRIEK